MALSEPIDLTQLAEARHSSNTESWWQEPHFGKPIADAVDALLEADQIKWCRTHESSAFDTAELCYRMLAVIAKADDEPCSFVSMVVVPVEETP